MRTITQLYLVEKNRIRCFDSSTMTPKEFQTFKDLNKRMYISVKTDDQFRQTSLDYSHMITDYSLGSIDTWDKLAEALTDELVDGYGVDMPGFEPGTRSPKKYPKYWDALNTLQTFNIHYSDIYSDLTDLYAYRWNLQDLKFTLQPDPVEAPVLANCLPIVNGYFCYPVWHETRQCLYAKGGAHLCWQQGMHRTPEALLLDMSVFGGYFTQNIRRGVNPNLFTTLKVLNKNDRFDIESDWLISFPHDLNDVTPIVVICGIPILPDMYQVVEQRSVRFNLRMLPLHHALAFKQYLWAKTNSDADIAYSPELLSTYLERELNRDKDDLSPDTFVIYVRSPKLYVAREHLDVWNKNLVMNIYSDEGILQHNATGCIKAFHMDEYSDRKELTVQNMEDLYMADMKFYEQQLAFIEPRCNHHSFQNLQHSKMTMIYIMG